MLRLFSMMSIVCILFMVHRHFDRTKNTSKFNEFIPTAQGKSPAVPTASPDQPSILIPQSSPLSQLGPKLKPAPGSKVLPVATGNRIISSPQIQGRASSAAEVGSLDLSKGEGIVRSNYNEHYDLKLTRIKNRTLMPVPLPNTLAPQNENFRSYLSVEGPLIQNSGNEGGQKVSGIGVVGMKVQLPRKGDGGVRPRLVKDSQDPAAVVLDMP